MKVWQKVYLVTLAVFLLMLNVGLILGANYIFEHNVSVERQQCERECYFLQQNLEHDFSILKANGRMHIGVIQRVVDNYHNYYQSQDIFIELREAVEDKTNTRAMVIRGGKQIFIQVERTLAQPYGEYSVFYQKELVDFEKTWAKLQSTFILISVSLSLVLCILLFLMMQKFFKPLERLNRSVSEISKGNYEQNLQYKGEDEIAQLAENINTMAGTIREQIEKLEEENKKKQQLMDNLTHELRTPLTSIYGYAQLLQMGNISEEETYEGLEYIMKESKRLNKMSGEMLSMRLLERSCTDFVKVNLNKVALHIRRILAETLENKQIELVESFQTEECQGNEEEFIILFRNLLENAVRASREKSIVEWTAEQQENGYLFKVKDYGIGMEKEELEKVKDAFYRIDKGRSRSEGGAGLGLSIVDTIVKKWNGKLWIESVKDVGTTVFVELPIPSQEQN